MIFPKDENSTAGSSIPETGNVEIIATSGSYPTILLIHGAVVNRTMWKPHIKLLSRNHNILAPDLPGHGSLINQAFTLSGAVEVTINLINEFLNRPVIIVGDSLGGYVSMAAAGKYPEKIAALIVSGCTQNYLGIWGTLLKLNAGIGQWVINVFGEEKLTKITKSKLQRKINPELIDEIFDEGVRISSRIEALNGLINRRFSSLLINFNKPVLFINGEKDHLNQWGAKKFMEEVTNSKLKTIGNADHLVALSEPEKYVEAITSFLDEENFHI